jgi:hypothetical protein
MAMLRFGTRSFPMRSCQGGQIRAGVSQLKVSERLPHLSSNSRAELIGKMRAVFGIVGVFVGVYTYSPSVMAEGEEVSSQDDNMYGYGMPTILRGLINNTIEFENDASSGLSNIDYYHINNVHIPDAVWSLDVSAGVNLDRGSGGSRSATYAVFGGSPKNTEVWSLTIPGLWNDNITNHGQTLLVSPDLFQVASCGGSYAERINLEYCDSNDVNKDKRNDNTNNKRDKDSSATQGADNNVDTSNNINNVVEPNNNYNMPFSNLGVPSNIAPLTPPQFLMSGDLTLLGQCDGVSISCAPIDIEQPAPPIDSSAPESPTPPIDASTPPIDDPTPPIDLSSPPPDSGGSGGDSGAGLGQRPIPEAPTWVMTAIGFGIVAYLFRRKKNSQVNSIAIIDNTDGY